MLVDCTPNDSQTNESKPRQSVTLVRSFTHCCATSNVHTRPQQICQQVSVSTTIWCMMYAGNKCTFLDAYRHNRLSISPHLRPAEATSALVIVHTRQCPRTLWAQKRKDSASHIDTVHSIWQLPRVYGLAARHDAEHLRKLGVRTNLLCLHHSHKFVECHPAMAIQRLIDCADGL